MIWYWYDIRNIEKLKKKQYKYRFKCKTLSIPLFEECGKIFYDCICIFENLDVKSTQIYNRIRFDRKYVISFPICYYFANTRCEDAVRFRMTELMQKNPQFSLTQLEKITGHSRSTIVRHYMTLKREISRGKL